MGAVFRVGDALQSPDLYRRGRPAPSRPRAGPDERFILRGSERVKVPCSNC